MKAFKVSFTSELFNFVFRACTVMVFLGQSGPNGPKFFVLWLIGFTFINFSLVLYLSISETIHLVSIFLFFLSIQH